MADRGRQPRYNTHDKKIISDVYEQAIEHLFAIVEIIKKIKKPNCEPIIDRKKLIEGIPLTTNTNIF